MTATFEDLGVPVRSVNWVNVHPGAGSDGADRVWATMGQQADGFFVLDVDPWSGESRQVHSRDAEAKYPTATCAARSGMLYVGAAYRGHLFGYDGDRLEDLGAIHPEQATFPCRIDEDADGRLWIGSYPGADLTRYDPSTRQFERFGPVDDVDMYCYPLVDRESGLIACLIKMTRQHVVLFDPATREKTEVGPSLTKEEGALSLVRGADGRLYVQSEEAAWVIDGKAARLWPEPVEEAPPPRLSDGSTFRFADAGAFLYRRLEVQPPTGAAQTVDVDYEAAGSEIFTLHEGPDGRVYGSSILPLHLFAHDPRSGETVDYGKASESGGEVYSMANHDGRLYLSSYPAARISVYDPSRPYEYGTSEMGNPRDIGRIDDVSYRPRSTLAGPLGRIWTASLPDYGLWGGPLAWLDPESGERRSYRDVAGEGSCYSLAWLEREGLIAVGTTVQAGTGTQPRAEEAALLLWDPTAEAAVGQGSPTGGLTAVNALVVDGQGRLVGTAVGEGRGIAFAFQPADRRFDILSEDLPGLPLDNGLQLRVGVVGVTDRAVYRVGKTGIDVVLEEDGAFDVAGPILDGWLYFAKNHRLRRLKLPDRVRQRTSISRLGYRLPKV